MLDNVRDCDRYSHGHNGLLLLVLVFYLILDSKKTHPRYLAFCNFPFNDNDFPAISVVHWTASQFVRW